MDYSENNDDYKVFEVAWPEHLAKTTPPMVRAYLVELVNKMFKDVCGTDYKEPCNSMHKRMMEHEQ